MHNWINRNMPEDDVKRRWLAIFIMVAVSGMFTWIGIYWIRQYGIALFILIPLLLGAGTTLLFGSNKEVNFKQAVRISFTALAIFMLSVFVCAMEGLICLLMAAPFGLLFTWIGSIIGVKILQVSPEKGPSAMLFLFISIPVTAVLEREGIPASTSVVTSIEIEADPQTVWKQVVEFPQLEEPTEFIFKSGIAYPIHAKITGRGRGAIRYCHFSTGSFVEPITIWDEPRLLRFNVSDQPVPMKEISFWDLDAPHLHDYFVSKKGQFKLIDLQNGRTRLEGTTWYYNRIQPAFYWHWWSDEIIHQIHQRVLKHIKKNAEKEKHLMHSIQTNAFHELHFHG